VKRESEPELKDDRPPTHSYRSGGTDSSPRRRSNAVWNQIEAAVDSIWFLIKRGSEWLYELSRWLR
jgi:hypothetical protein